jgi:DNA-binding transcriptional MocR family regulator
MYLTGWLPPGWCDRAVAAALAGADVSAVPLSSLTLATERPSALVLGYSGHAEAAVERAVERMASVLEHPGGMFNSEKPELRSDQLSA